MKTTFDHDEVWYPSDEEYAELYDLGPYEAHGFLRMFQGGMSVLRIMDMFELRSHEFASEFNKAVLENNDAEWSQRPLHVAFMKGAE